MSESEEEAGLQVVRAVLALETHHRCLEAEKTGRMATVHSAMAVVAGNKPVGEVDSIARPDIVVAAGTYTVQEPKYQDLADQK